MKKKMMARAALAGLAVSASSLLGGAGTADAAASCINNVYLDVITPGGWKYWLSTSCANTNGTQARGVIDCAWLPDPKTGWISGVGSSNAWTPCPYLNYRNARIEIR